MSARHSGLWFLLSILFLVSILFTACTGDTSKTSSAPSLQPSTQPASSPAVSSSPSIPPVPSPALPPASPPPVSSPLPVKKYIGSVQSNKYHDPSCEWAQKITHPVWFNSVVEAQAKGYVPCKACKPPAND